MKLQQNFILFVKNTCQFSQEVVKMLGAANIQRHFIIVNIDNPALLIPSFVDRVPMIYNKNKKEVVIEDDIILFIEEMKKQVENISANPISLPGAGLNSSGPSEIMTISDISKGFSNNYSFISDTGVKDDAQSRELEPKNFFFINDDTSQTSKSSAYKGGGGGSDKPSKFDSKVFENYMSQRENDAAQFLSQKPRTI